MCQNVTYVNVRVGPRKRVDSVFDVTINFKATTGASCSSVHSPLRDCTSNVDTLLNRSVQSASGK